MAPLAPRLWTMPNSTQLTAALKSLDLLSSEERRIAEVHLAMLRLSPERRARLLEMGLDLGALADDLDVYLQDAKTPLGSLEDVQLAANHVTAYIETDEARFGADGKPTSEDELWDRNGNPYALDKHSGNPIHDPAQQYLAPESIKASKEMEMEIEIEDDRGDDYGSSEARSR